MRNLKDKDKPNLNMYKVAHILAMKRPGRDKTLLPMDRMPFGLLQYQILFFSCTNSMQVGKCNTVLTVKIHIE
jgi:hypothetical protein